MSGMGVASAGTARSRLALRSAELALPEPGSVTPGSAPFGSGKGRGEKGKQRPGEPRRGGFGDKHGEFGGPVTPVAALGSPGGGSCPGGCTRAGSHRGTHARAHRGWCVTCGPCWVTPAPHSDGRGVGQEQEQPLPPPAGVGDRTGVWAWGGGPKEEGTGLEPLAFTSVPWHSAATSDTESSVALPNLSDLGTARAELPAVPPPCVPCTPRDPRAPSPGRAPVTCELSPAAGMSRGAPAAHPGAAAAPAAPPGPAWSCPWPGPALRKALGQDVLSKPC